MKFSAPWWFCGGTLAYLFFVNGELPGAWTTDPGNRWGGPAFLLWLLSICFLAWRRRPLARPLVVWIPVLLLAVAGELGRFNILQHLALAVALSSLVRPAPAALLLAVAALSWMPAWGWVAQQVAGSSLDLLRPVAPLVALALATGLFKPRP